MPRNLHERQVWAVSGESILAGCQFIGQWQEKLSDIVREVRKKRIILFVEDIATLAESGRHSKGDENLADFLKPYVQSGDVILIGAVTPERLRRAEQLTPGFVAQLRSLEIAPTSETDTLSILSSLAREMERGEDLRVEPSALEAAVELTNRYMPYRAQPGKAIALVEQIVADALRNRGSGRATVARRELIVGFTRQSGMPEFLLADNLALDLDGVQAHFADRIIGQEEAVAAMVDLIAVVKAGLNDPGKPLGVYLFIGPTGVGKTQLAKALAGYLFGDERRLIRFDMSEYSDPTAIRRLIGTPGTGRDGAEGELTRTVRAQPFCVLLLDEFEKADPQIFDVFLQVLGEGRLSDATGATTSFQNAIVIMTSNLGASAREQRTIGLSTARIENSEPRTQDPGAGAEPSSEGNGERGSRLSVLGSGSAVPGSDYWQRRVEQHFRPEFVNRIDRIVAFKALDASAMRRIARREIGDVLLREGFVRRNVLVEVEDNVIDLLIERGFTATYGARPLKRAIEQLIVLPLARHLAGRDKPGGDLLRLRRAGDEVTLNAINTSGERGEVLVEGGARKRRVDDRSLAESFAELRRKLDDWTEGESLRAMRDERAASLADTNKPTFWDDGDAARRTLARFYVLDRLLKRLQQLTDRAAYLEELAGLVHRQRDPRYRAELGESLETLDRDAAFLEVELLCAHLEDNHRAVLRIKRVGMAGDEEGETWLARLAAIYLRWANRKGYDVGLFALEPLPETALRGDGLIPRHYPYRWQPIDVSSPDDALRAIMRSAANELAIGLEGTNVYGFLKGEAGLHRRNEKRPSGERIQRLAEIQVTAIGEDSPDLWLDKLLLARALEERDRAAMTKKQLAALPTPPEPELVRVYQLEGERLVRDPRTHVKIGAVASVLDGGLDDFILAYLREAEARTAWE